MKFAYHMDLLSNDLLWSYLEVKYISESLFHRHRIGLWVRTIEAYGSIPARRGPKCYSSTHQLLGSLCNLGGHGVGSSILAQWWERRSLFDAGVWGIANLCFSMSIGGGKGETRPICRILPIPPGRLKVAATPLVLLLLPSQTSCCNGGGGGSVHHRRTLDLRSEGIRGWDFTWWSYFIHRLVDASRNRPLGWGHGEFYRTFLGVLVPTSVSYERKVHPFSMQLFPKHGHLLVMH